MATLAGQRAQFTWSLRQYNLAETPEQRERYARRMARIINAAPGNGFTEEQVTQGQLYPAAEVKQYLNEPIADTDTDISEGQAVREVEEAVDSSDVLHLGEGPNTVYAYGYRCAPDRLKIGMTDGETIQRIAAQIGTGTPDKPVLHLEIKTHDCASLERAIHNVLGHRGRKITGGGKEWFKTNREEVIAIYKFIVTQK